MHIIISNAIISISKNIVQIQFSKLSRKTCLVRKSRPWHFTLVVANNSYLGRIDCIDFRTNQLMD